MPDEVEYVCEDLEALRRRCLLVPRLCNLHTLVAVINVEDLFIIFVVVVPVGLWGTNLI